MRTSYIMITAAMASLASFGVSAMETTVVEANVSQPRAVVSYADLKLSKAADVATLNKRVRSAANAICISRGARGLKDIINGIECRDTAIESAKPQIEAAVRNYGDTQLASKSSAVIALN